MDVEELADGKCTAEVESAKFGAVLEEWGEITEFLVAFLLVVGLFIF